MHPSNLFFSLLLSVFSFSAISAQKEAKLPRYEFQIYRSINYLFTDITNYNRNSDILNYNSTNYGLSTAFILEAGINVSSDIMLLIIGEAGSVSSQIDMLHLNQKSNFMEGAFRHTASINRNYFSSQIGLAYKLYSSYSHSIKAKISMGFANFGNSSSSLEPPFPLTHELVEGDNIFLEISKRRTWAPIISTGIEYTLSFTELFHAKLGLGYRLGLSEFASIDKIGNYINSTEMTTVASFDLDYSQFIFSVGIGIRF